MKTFATLALGIGLALATPATAQVMGSTNRNAPTCTHIMQFSGGGKLTIKYRAITWASGEWAKNLERIRPYVNSSAQRSPMGELHAVGKFTFGGKTLNEGKYKVYFTLTEKLKWVLNVQDMAGETEAVTWELDLKETGSKQTRLGMLLKPTENDDVGHLHLAFGPKGMEVPFMPAPPEDKK